MKPPYSRPTFITPPEGVNGGKGVDDIRVNPLFVCRAEPQNNLEQDRSSAQRIRAANPQLSGRTTEIWTAVAERSGDTAFRAWPWFQKRRGASLPAAVQDRSGHEKQLAHKTAGELRARISEPAVAA